MASGEGNNCYEKGAYLRVRVRPDVVTCPIGCHNVICGGSRDPNATMIMSGGDYRSRVDILGETIIADPRVRVWGAARGSWT